MKWNQRFPDFLKKNGWEVLKYKPCIFKNKDATLLIAIHVDDGYLASDEENKMTILLNQLKKELEMTDVNNPQTFPGL